jgi:flap endonuclease-1
MGIAKLNRYLTDNCKNGTIKKIHLKELESKTIVIDVSIYLYKFLSNGDLIEQMYLFISILRSYNIVPVFIFDGKPPEEKREILMKRYMEKKEAAKECKKLEDSLDSVSIEKKRELEKQILLLKKKSIRIKENDINIVKELMRVYGVQYLNADEEADQLCGYLANKENIYGCISDDMDMFMYNCKYVLRHLSLLNHTVVLYDRENICRDLNVKSSDLQDILLTVGSDYNLKNNYTIANAFEKYKVYNTIKDNKSYFEYLQDTDKTIDINKLYKLKKLLNSLQKSNMSIKDKNNLIKMDDLKHLLKPYGFCWCK